MTSITCTSKCKKLDKLSITRGAHGYGWPIAPRAICTLLLCSIVAPSLSLYAETLKKPLDVKGEQACADEYMHFEIKQAIPSQQSSDPAANFAIVSSRPHHHQ